MSINNEILEIYKNINLLKQEHQELDTTLQDPDQLLNLSEFTIQKLKRRKLILKDQITSLQRQVNPDDIA